MTLMSKRHGKLAAMGSSCNDFLTFRVVVGVLGFKFVHYTCS